MRTIRAIIIGMPLLLAATLLPAQPLQLTLEEAIALGLANSSAVRSRAIGVEQARLDVAAARSGYYPSVSIGAGYVHLFEQPELPDGTPLSPTDPLSFSVEVGQLVTTFGRMSTGVNMAREGMRSAELDLAEENRALSTRIQRAFYGYLLAGEALEINRQTLANRQEALEVARQKFRAGVASDFEVLQAEADVEAFRPTLLAAENQVQLALLTVRDLLNIPEGQAAEVELVGELVLRELNLDRQALLQQALANKHELASLRQAIRLSELQQELNRKAGLPTISAFVGYQAESGMKDDGSGDNLWWGEGSWDGTLTAGLNVSVPVSSWFPWSNQTVERHKNRLSTEDLNLALRSAESGIRLAVENALLQLEQQREATRSGQKNIELAERLYASAREQYARGFISSLELRDTQLRLSEARLGYIRAVHAWTLALIDLQDAVGVDHF